MPIFLVVRRILTASIRYKVMALLAFAALVILVGGVLFSVFEQVDFGTSLYWSVVTATTVGYGDITPHTTPGKVVPPPSC